MLSQSGMVWLAGVVVWIGVTVALLRRSLGLHRRDRPYARLERSTLIATALLGGALAGMGACVLAAGLGG